MDESPNPKVSMIASLISDPVGRQSTAAMAAFYNLNFQPDRVERIGWSQAELERLFLAATAHGRESSRVREIKSPESRRTDTFSNSARGRQNAAAGGLRPA